MRLALVIVTAVAFPAAADPPPHALISIAESVGREDSYSTQTTDLTLAGRATPSFWGYTTGRTGNSHWACGDCVQDGQLREGTAGVLYLPCHGTLCFAASAGLGYARRDLFYPSHNTASGGTTPSSYEVDDWFVAEARGHVMLRLADHIALDGGIALRYMRRLFDDSLYPNAGGAVVSIALGAWL